MIEGIVAIFVILFAVVSALALADASLLHVARFKQELIATNLAQEGIELVRNKRDSNYLNCKLNGFGVICDQDNPNSADWNEITPKCDGAGCTIEWTHFGPIGPPHRPQLNDFNFVDVSGGGPCADPQDIVRFDGEDDSDSGFYACGQSTWQDTIFSRVIKTKLVTLAGGRQDLFVNSEVTWLDRFSGTKRAVVRTYLTPHLY